jgi:hypothetical protein
MKKQIIEFTQNGIPSEIVLREYKDRATVTVDVPGKKPEKYKVDIKNKHYNFLKRFFAQDVIIIDSVDIFYVLEGMEDDKLYIY